MRFAAVLASLLALCSMLACGGPEEYTVVGTARAAGTDGSIQVEEIEGGNRLVTISLQHLPPPSRMGDDRSVYAAWFIASNAPATKAGNLEFDEDTREARLMATTPLAEFTVRVTAEVDENAGQPSDIVVVERRVEE